jgi:hypothetical protein
MKVLLLRNAAKDPYTVIVRGVFRKKYYLVIDSVGLIELPIIKEVKGKP